MVNLMMSTQLLLSLTFNILFFAAGTNGATIYFTNKCPYMVWPGSLTSDQKPQLPDTGFVLGTQESKMVDTPVQWNGRFWARTGCTSDVSGKFSCATAECASGEVSCKGNGAIPPATLVEMNIFGAGGKDFYDVSLVDGFNLPISVTPQGGNGDCRAATCPANVNAACPSELQIKGGDGSVIACKSACLEFKEPKYCCTGANNKPETCPPTDYSDKFHKQCPNAYSYAYDDLRGTFTCSDVPNYRITFCP